MNEEDEIRPDEQHAFCLARDMAKAMEKNGADPHAVGRGLLVCATYQLRKSMSTEQIAELFYEHADDWAVFNFDK